MVLVPEGAQEAEAFTLGETIEKVFPRPCVAVAQRARRRVGGLIGMVVHDVAHDAHEGEIHRLLDRFGDGRILRHRPRA